MYGWSAGRRAARAAIILLLGPRPACPRQLSGCKESLMPLPVVRFVFSLQSQRHALPLTFSMGSSRWVAVSSALRALPRRLPGELMRPADAPSSLLARPTALNNSTRSRVNSTHVLPFNWLKVANSYASTKFYFCRDRRNSYISFASIEIIARPLIVALESENDCFV